MNRTFALGFCAAAALAIGAFQIGQASQPAAVPRKDPRLLSAIEKANREFEVAMTKSDVVSIVAPYTDDAVFLTPDGTARKGRTEIEQLYRDRFARSGPALETRIESGELMLDGDLAYERGRGTTTRRVKEERVTDSARFLTVWQRQPGGDWKIYRNVVLPAR